MEVINMHEAKTNLSKLVEKALAGEPVYISKRGNLVVQLTPVKPSGKKRAGGQWNGKVVIDDEFDTLPSEISDVFAGKE
ncbi:MAG: type II toxin-antitoxin system prevent-host-death family antitoxin [Cyclobacteriaceae bacterium]